MQGLHTQRVPSSYQHSRLAISHVLPIGAGVSGQLEGRGGSSQRATSGSVIIHSPLKHRPLTRHSGRGSVPHAQ